MAGLEFSVPGIQIACTDTVATKLGVKAPANQCLKVVGFWWSFDGSDSTKGPGLIEVGNCTFATNSPGTNSTSVTPYTTNGRTETIQATAGKTWTAEPTVITIPRPITLPTYMGSAMAFLPFARPILVPGGTGLVLRITLPSGVTVNFTGALDCEE